ncbi:MULTISPECIES: TetR/AcrR family transcriptional regulator [Paraburkholderia]|uniref:TetR/AcrR family transcriptional regulator n=1 Tax=Paraburkholderia TaxID=1822464 RepID=UPI00225300B0|nr:MULTISPECIES: TetR/AcrR family transcriptional regulator [Paraburkholderia]MCX4164524.1 TetR/AcrR family transcriptional regulator [Paraburkholderia megapolitana]MDN7160017.1 TetR/AcrR family transcriptional regulator [Paraburkholderia sp. CHISQ3]MDQ6497064.1 TetR/AcrR family transcriptional regulator [Paraburkholderia megapolitana]
MGTPERKRRQKQPLRERILDAARLIVTRDGFAALSMRKIADAIGYAPATLYLHFDSREQIVRALCAEGYVQLLERFAPLAAIVDSTERVKALCRAYVAFGIEQPQSYRLIFMEDPAHTDAAFVDATQDADHSSDTVSGLLAESVEQMKTAGRLPASADSQSWADALWATLHGIVALHLTCAAFPRTPPDKLVDTALRAWFGSAREPIAAAASAAGVALDVPAAPAAKRRATKRPAAKPKAAQP